MLICLLATTIKVVTIHIMMRQVDSMVVVEESGHPIGIRTDTDLRSRVLAFGRSPDSPVLKIMSQPAHTLTPDNHVLEALLTMSTNGVHHLVITEADRLLGLIGDYDLRGLTSSSPITGVRDIEKVANLGDLVRVRSKIRPRAGDAFEAGRLGPPFVGAGHRV
ncbi:hypothetical protein DFAR_2550007 [Desulfarculales bacterium]